VHNKRLTFLDGRLKKIFLKADFDLLKKDIKFPK